MSVTGSSTRSGSVDLTRNGVPPGYESDDELMEVDHDIVLDVVLPDGITRQMTVNSKYVCTNRVLHKGTGFLALTTFRGDQNLWSLVNPVT
jgi:hypothetical protein